ncbi:MAG: hypothetical protein AAGC71_03695 [Pseudomonadota bacterium]
MNKLLPAVGVVFLAACGGSEPPPEPAAEPDGGVIGEAYLDAERRAQEAVDAAAARKSDLDTALERAEGRDEDD